MSVRNSLLAILTIGPCYGSQLKAEFERRTGGAWQLNVGQVYTTLSRLARDGLAARCGIDASGRERFEITDSGRAAVAAWLRSPAPIATAPRDEFVMKAVVGMTLPGVDLAAILEAQEREASADCARAPVDAPSPADLVRLAQREQADGQLRWIRHLRAATLPSPWGLAAELPKRGRPQKAGATAS